MEFKMDLNFKRRAREQRIAVEVAEQFVRETRSSEQAAPPELLAHHMGLVFQRLNFIPDQAAIARVLAYASKEIARRDRVISDLTAAINRLPAPAGLKLK
jgi:ABC-type lipoprotein export system ATPase subunit